MKRISWTLSTFTLPDFKIYDTATNASSVQTPIDIGSRPTDNTYFIGIPTGTSDKLLCYHTTLGKYIVISYNFSSAKLLQNVLDADLYNIDVVDSAVDDNPDSIPVINSTITSVT